jgi:hypothetical protein
MISKLCAADPDTPHLPSEKDQRDIMSSSSEMDIVISGISGRYPESMNMQEFWDNLLSGQELSSEDDRRYPVGK